MEIAAKMTQQPKTHTHTNFVNPNRCENNRQFCAPI